MSLFQQWIQKCSVHFFAYAAIAVTVLVGLLSYQGWIFDSILATSAAAFGAFATILFIYICCSEYFGLIKFRQITKDALAETQVALVSANARADQAEDDARRAREETRRYQIYMASFCRYLASGEAAFRCPDVQDLQQIVREGTQFQAASYALLQRWFYEHHRSFSSSDSDGPDPNVLAIEQRHLRETQL